MEKGSTGGELGLKLRKMSGNLEKPTKHQAQLSLYTQCLLSARFHVILLIFWIRTRRVTGTSSDKNH